MNVLQTSLVHFFLKKLFLWKISKSIKLVKHRHKIVHLLKFWSSFQISSGIMMKKSPERCFINIMLLDFLIVPFCVQILPMLVMDCRK